MMDSQNMAAAIGQGESSDEDVRADSGSSTTKMAPTQARKKPPQETPEASRLRSKVVLSFWAVIVVLGLPMWWQTTSIYRAKLPIQQMLDWSEGLVFGIYIDPLKTDMLTESY